MSREFLRHALATLSYRASKVIRDAPPEFASMQMGGTTRTPGAILAHLGDLLDWGLSMAEGKQKWVEAAPLPWNDEAGRFHASLKKFDAFLASDMPLVAPPERLFQGPIADALTHVGQLAMMRRIAGAPIKPENYFKADITTGKLP